MDLWELVAREEIRELVARYAHFADSGRFEELVALFAEDGLLQIDDREPLRGRDAILAFLASTRSAVRESSAVRSIRHHVSSLRIDVSAPVAATGSSYFLVVTQRGPDHWGRYRDRYTVSGSRWLFAAREVRVDGIAAGSWAAARRGAPEPS
jgi:SnoaL-like domain